MSLGCSRIRCIPPGATWHAGYLAPAPDATPFGKDAALLGRPIISYTVRPGLLVLQTVQIRRPAPCVALQHLRTAPGALLLQAHQYLPFWGSCARTLTSTAPTRADLGAPCCLLQGHASLRDNMRLQRLVQQLGLLVTSGSSLPAAGHAASDGGNLAADADAEVLSGLHSQVLQMGDAIFLELAQQVTALLWCAACLCPGFRHGPGLQGVAAPCQSTLGLPA